MFIAIWQFSVRSPNSKKIGASALYVFKNSFLLYFAKVPVFSGLKTHTLICPCKHTSKLENSKKAWCRWIGRGGGKGSGLTASACDRWAHSILFHLPAIPWDQWYYPGFAKDKFLEKIMNRNQTTICWNLPSFGGQGWIAVSAPSSCSGHRHITRGSRPGVPWTQVLWWAN